MAIDLGLSHKEWTELNQLLVSHHAIAVTVQLLTLEHGYVADISDKLLGGQVTIDSAANETTRACEIEVLDPGHRLKLDGDAPEDGSVYFTRMLRVVYSVMPPDRGKAFHIPVFTGPLSKVERSGPVISITAVGKEKLAMASVWKGRSYKKGNRKTYVIKHILSVMAGERKLDLVERTTKLPRKISLNTEKKAWVTAKSLASGMGLQLFYDGRGVARLRKAPSSVVYTFGQKGALLSLPQAAYDAENAVNAVSIVGGKPPKAKKKVTYKLVAPRSHALSPWNLGRWGVPRYLVESISDSSIKSLKEARALAKRRLKAGLIEAVDVAFDSLPIPYLEESDLCRVQSDDFNGLFRLSKMTIPLTADGTSSVGYLRRVTPNPRQIRIKNTTKKRKRR